ncbi:MULTISPECIES: pilus assembly protein TadG-related protein [unclassified Streptomyces]|uniref:pilus assembly protein TadG-related protein n=1 Tax=unclassified Streptomyces TaxID=2593676 RepID=UPI002E81123F|nr:pilus assembly protein TadG-related protein [Streptomyces sp. NBC_00582]WUB68466.1 pilus assembly protein TadG-related protein [Streptomyces sp. NBC_00582]
MNPLTRLRTLLTPLRDDRGSLSLWWILMVIPLLIMLGITYDLGGKLRDIEHADAIAAEAARAGAQAIDPAQAVPGDAVVLDPAKAAAEARRYLTAAGVDGTVTVDGNGTTITVDVTTRRPTVFLQVIGQPSLDVEGHASAELLHGVGAPEE